MFEKIKHSNEYWTFENKSIEENIEGKTNECNTYKFSNEGTDIHSCWMFGNIDI